MKKLVSVLTSPSPIFDINGDIVIIKSHLGFFSKMCDERSLEYGIKFVIDGQCVFINFDSEENRDKVFYEITIHLSDNEDTMIHE